MRSVGPLLRIAAPLLAACIVILAEPSLTRLVGSRPGILPVAMFSLIAALLLPAARRWLIVTLCFGISLLALRDCFKLLPPPALDFESYYLVYRIGWATLAALAAGAGVVEAIKPGSVWGRRCYFGAAALYFTGHGLSTFLRTPNWQSLMLVVTGVVAMAGVVFAHRIVASETRYDEDEDTRQQKARVEQRAARLAAREWHELPDDRPQAAGLKS